MEWYDRIRALREDNDWTQTYVAKYLGIKQSYYSEYERNKHDLPIRHIISLAKLYDVTTDYLLCCTNNPDKPAAKNVHKINIKQRDGNTNHFRF